MRDSNILKKHIGYWLNRLRNVVHYAFEARLAQYGISVAEWSILVSIYDDSANSVNNVAAYIEIDKASVSRVVERLAKKDLLSVASGDDRRSKILSLTEKGQKLILKLFKEAEENDLYFFGCLSQLEQRQMRSIMHKALQKVPGINLDGWINNKKHEVIMNAIKNILKDAMVNQWPYPKTFEALKAEGLQNYEVRFIGSYRAEFNGIFGSFMEENLDGYKPIKESDYFNSNGIKNAVINHVTEKTHYLEFLQDTAANGATHFRVDIAKRTVTYLNSNESASYIEYVPEYET